MSFLASLPNAALMDLFKAYPELAAPLHQFAHRLMRGPSPFTEGERELLAAYVSGLNRCEYCEATHTAVAMQLGIPEGLLLQLKSGLEGATVPKKLIPVLHFVRKLNASPALVNQTDVAAVREAGWDESAVVHAALVCGFFNLMNRWVDGLGIKPDPDSVKTAAEILGSKGYGAIAELLEPVSASQRSGPERPRTAGRRGPR